ncbi:MAG: hypothetical protein U0517_02615 [Candidatus Andersenbacteria bacterium]
MSTPATYARISDPSLKKATGKTWSEWFKILDRAGAKRMNHTQIATWLYDGPLKKGWWCQMVAVGYEQARGLRAVHQTATGYAVSISKVMPVALPKLYATWTSVPARKKWLGLKNKDITLTTSNKNKNVRGKWIDGRSTLAIDFYRKGLKTQVVVQHEKLPNKAAVEKQRAFWKAALARLARSF